MVIPPLQWPCLRKGASNGRVWQSPHLAHTVLFSLLLSQPQPCWKSHSSREHPVLLFLFLLCPSICLGFYDSKSCYPNLRPGARAGRRSFEQGNRKHTGSRRTWWCTCWKHHAVSASLRLPRSFLARGNEKISNKSAENLKFFWLLVLLAISLLGADWNKCIFWFGNHQASWGWVAMWRLWCKESRGVLL